MTAETEPQDGQQGQRVLLAEDEALIRLDLAEMLTEAGYEVVGQASNGEEAVSLAESLRPDLIIMDVKMPVMDGLTAAETIGEQRICPVIMLTAFSQKELVERARDAGVMAYIVKPFTVSDVTPAIEVATSRWAELKALEDWTSTLHDVDENLAAALDRLIAVLEADGLAAPGFANLEIPAPQGQDPAQSLAPDSTS